MNLACNYIVDDGGNNTDGLTWATAYTSLVSLLASETLVHGDSIAFGHNTIDQNVYAANIAFAMASGTGLPVTLVSVTQGTGSVAGGGFVYQVAANAQIDTDKDGAFDITISNTTAIHGLWFKVGDVMTLDANASGNIYHQDMVVELAQDKTLSFLDPSGSSFGKNLTINCGGGATTLRALLVNGNTTIDGLTFTNGADRTGEVIDLANNTKYTYISGADFTAFSNVSPPNLVSGSNLSGLTVIENAKTDSNFALMDPSASWRGGEVLFSGCGPANNPEQSARFTMLGSVESSAGVLRTGGAEVEGNGLSWLFKSGADVGPGAPIISNWIYSDVLTGSQNFDLFISHKTQNAIDVGDLTDAQIWMELQYKDMANTNRWALVDSSVLSDDVASVWGGSPAYMQRLRITANPLTAGLCRARVVCAIPSLVLADALHVDPVLVVS